MIIITGNHSRSELIERFANERTYIFMLRNIVLPFRKFTHVEYSEDIGIEKLVSDIRSVSRNNDFDTIVVYTTLSHFQAAWLEEALYEIEAELSFGDFAPKLFVLTEYRSFITTKQRMAGYDR